MNNRHAANLQFIISISLAKVIKKVEGRVGRRNNRFSSIEAAVETYALVTRISDLASGVYSAHSEPRLRRLYYCTVDVSCEL